MIKARLWGELSELKALIEYLSKLAPEIEIMQQSEPYTDRGKSKYNRIYLEIKLKESADAQLIKTLRKIYTEVCCQHPLKTKVKDGVNIEQVVCNKYVEFYVKYNMFLLDWKDIDGVLDYLYGIKLTLQDKEVTEIIRYIESNCEVAQ